MQRDGVVVLVARGAVEAEPEEADGVERDFVTQVACFAVRDHNAVELFFCVSRRFRQQRSFWVRVTVRV